MIRCDDKKLYIEGDMKVQECIICKILKEDLTVICSWNKLSATAFICTSHILIFLTSLSTTLIPL